MILDSSSAMMPRNSPTPAETASLRFCGIELDHILADTEHRDQEEQHAGAEHRGERLLPGIFVGQHHGEGEEGVDAHAGRQRDRVIGVERHHHGAHRGGHAGGDEHRARIHAGLAEDRRIDEHDVDHGEERGQTGDEFGADVGALLLEPEIALQPCRDRRFARCRFRFRLLCLLRHRVPLRRLPQAASLARAPAARRSPCCGCCGYRRALRYDLAQAGNATSSQRLDGWD